jgi:hypothetical protein
MNRLVVGIIIGLALGATVSVSLTLILIQPKLGSIFEQTSQASDFLGLWYNDGMPNSGVLISGFLISENQGTYTIHAFRTSEQDYGTQILVVNPPNAHVFYTYQYGSLDLQLQLLNLTSMQVKESLQIDGATTIVNVEQFRKYSTTSFQVSETTTLSSSFSQVKDQLIMEAYQWQDPAILTMSLRNTGSTTIDLAAADFYVGGSLQTLTAGTCTGGTFAALGPGTACTVSVTLTGRSVTVGVAYVIRISLNDGAVMSYSAVAGSSA